MPEHIAFISSKSGVDPCRDGRVIGLTRKECRQTAFQLYIVLASVPALLCRV